MRSDTRTIATDLTFLSHLTAGFYLFLLTALLPFFHSLFTSKMAADDWKCAAAETVSLHQLRGAAIAASRCQGADEQLATRTDHLALPEKCQTGKS